MKKSENEENEIRVILKKGSDRLKILGEESSNELFEFFAKSNLHLNDDDLNKYTAMCFEYICDINSRVPREAFCLRLQGRINGILNALYKKADSGIWEVLMEPDGSFCMLCDKKPVSTSQTRGDQPEKVFAFKLASFESMMKEFREDDYPLVIDFFNIPDPKMKKRMVHVLSDAAGRMGMAVKPMDRDSIEEWIRACGR